MGNPSTDLDAIDCDQNDDTESAPGGDMDTADFGELGAHENRERDSSQQPLGTEHAGGAPTSSNQSSRQNLSIPELQTAQRFIDALRSATLDESNMDPEDIARLRSPSPDTYGIDIKDVHLVKALKQFLASQLSSREQYEETRRIHKEAYPNDPYLSYDQVKRLLGKVTGVTPIYHDMCSESCAGYTGPYADLDKCPVCARNRRSDQRFR